MLFRKISRPANLDFVDDYNSSTKPVQNRSDAICFRYAGEAKLGREPLPMAIDAQDWNDCAYV